MKKIIKLIIFLFFVFGFSDIAHAASISVTSNISTATSGGKVTFYVNISGAASWQITGSGTGATSNCSLNEANASENAGNVNKTLSVTCPATDVGQISFSVSGNITDANGKTQDVSGRKIVVVQAPRPKDENNYLKSLSVKDYQITPEFNKDTAEYSLEVPSTVDKVVLEATAESGYANVSGIGEMEVNEGINNFDIVVTSETGVERVYKLKIEVKDSNPINVQINNNFYTVIKNIKSLTKPDLYEETTIKIDDFDIPAFVSDVTKFTLIGVKDENGKIFLVIYDEKSKEYTLYNEQKSSTIIVYIMEPIEDIEGYHKTKLELEGISYHVFQRKDNSPFYLVYGMNIETGEKGYFVYHKKSGTFQEYDEEVLKDFQEEKKIRENIIIGLGITVVFLILLCIFAFVHKSHKKKCADKELDETDETLSLIQIEENKDQELDKKENLEDSFKKSEKVDPEKLYVKDAVQKMNDVEKLIEEYEKTVSLSKKELEEKKTK